MSARNTLGDRGNVLATSEEPDFDALRKTVVAGIDPNTDPPIIPTLVLEYSDRVDINVLEPAPDYSDVRDVSNAWVTDLVQSCDDLVGYCVAIAISPDCIEIQLFGNSVSHTLHGIIDRENQSITWGDPKGEA